MAYVDVACEADDRVARIRLNRPEKLNALNRGMLDDLARAVGEARLRPGVRVALVESTGQRAFSAGADIDEWRSYDGPAAYDACLHGQVVFDALAALPVPTIAVIDGIAVGGGLELALACDLRLGSDRATLGFPEAKLGGGLGWSGLSRLVPLVGPARAKDLVFTGRLLTADEARELGLLTAVHPADRLADAAIAVAAQIAANGPIPLRIEKQIIDALSRVAVPGLLEAISGAVYAETADAREGKAAFVDRRPPVFRGA